MFGFIVVWDAFITVHTYTMHFFVYYRYVTEKVADPLSVHLIAIAD